MALPLIDVVILNYNTREILAQCLPKVLEYSQGENIRIVVADNASTDDSVDYIKSQFSETVTLIELDQNYGFAGGYNQALAQCNGDYFVLLNSDAEPAHKDWLNELVALVLEHPKLGAAQPKILDYKQRDRFEYAGAAGGYIDRFGFPFCRGRIFGNVEIDTHQYDESTRLFWATGAALFVKRSVWELAGGLDTSFFAHMEEIDLCWRIQLLGYEIWSCPKSSVFHIGGATLSNQNPRKTFLNFRNGLMMLYKNLHPSERNRRILQRKLFDGLAGVFFILQGKPLHTLQIIKAHREFDKLRSTLSLSSNPKLLSELVGVLNESLVFGYFFRAKKTWSHWFRQG